VTIEKDRARPGLRVDINADSLPVVVRPVFDFERPAPDAQGGARTKNENAGWVMLGRHAQLVDIE
jgi:hypothetical protein